MLLKALAIASALKGHLPGGFTNVAFATASELIEGTANDAVNGGLVEVSLFHLNISKADLPFHKHLRICLTLNDTIVLL